MSQAGSEMNEVVLAQEVTSENAQLPLASKGSKEKGRFKVNIVHYEDAEDQDSLSPPTNRGVKSQLSSHPHDNTHNLRTFGRNTSEALPNIDFYRNTGSVENKFKRPTLAELHGDESKPLVETATKARDGKERKPQQSVLKFGWIQGVLVRCLLNIWGVMLFLRLSWVTGQAGIGLATAIILLATVVTTLTTLSMSAICTNGEVKGGGTYYMISRSMGPEFGGAIGIVFSFANAVAVAMHVVGFSETMRDILQEHNITLFDPDNDVRVIGVLTILLLLIIALIGMEWEARAQVVMLIILVVSIANFVVGALMVPDDEKRNKGVAGLYENSPFYENLGSDFRNGEDFFSIFGIFFPAATGILAGANISGDLKNPSIAIPKGTLLAILISSAVYIAFVWLCGATVVRDAMSGILVSGGDYNCSQQACDRGLMHDFRVIEVVSGWGPIIIAGAFAATLSSALAALVSAPKIFQALCKDRIFPFIHVFAKGYGPTDEPRRGYLLTFLVAVAFILIGKLNVIAPLISNFFLMSYGLVNYACFDASLANSPSWRPAFKYYNMYLSLLGSLLCIAAMFLMQWWASLITFGVVGAIYAYVHYKKPEVNWGSSTQAHVYNSALNAALKLTSTKEHVKNFRPQILVLSGLPSSRPALVDFVSNITKNVSLMVCANVLLEAHADGRSLLVSHTNHKVAQIYELMQKRKVKAFYSYITASSLRRGMQILLQSTGLGKLRPNTVIMGFKHDWQDSTSESVEQYVNIIHDAFDMHYGVGVLYIKEGFDISQYLSEEAGNDLLLLPSARKKHVTATAAASNQKQTYSLEEDDIELNELKGKTASKSNMSLPDDISDIDDEVDAFGEPAEEVEEQIDKDIMSADLLIHTIDKKVLQSINMFHHEQKRGTIDVWWLFDDGGLTLLLPYILSTKTNWQNCKLRVFMAGSKKMDLNKEQKNMATLLSKFRIDYDDMEVIPSFGKKPQQCSLNEFDELLKKYQAREEHAATEGKEITDVDLEINKDKTNRHIRFREIVLEKSQGSSLIVLTLPVPRKGSCPSGLYMAWLDTLTRNMPAPTLLLRGNQESVLTYYS